MNITSSDPLIQYGTARNLLNRELAWDKYGVGAGKYGIDFLNIAGDEIVLDIGSGTGRDAAIIAQRLNKGGQIFAIDISEPLLRLVHQRMLNSIVKSPCIRGTVVHLPFLANSFDVVLAKHVLNHVDDTEAALREMTRVVKRTGMVIVTTGVKTKEGDLLRRKHQEAILRLGIKKNVRLSRSLFDCDNAMSHLCQFFANVFCHLYSFQMVFDDVDSFMFYYTILPCFQEVSKQPEEKFRLASVMRKLISDETMPIVLDRSRGTFLCRNRKEA